MTTRNDDPPRRLDADGLDARVTDGAREALTGTTDASVYHRRSDPEDVTVPPDGRPMEEQPRWRRDFSIDWPRDHYVARRDFARFLVLTSGAFAAGQGWVAVQSLVRRREAPPPRRRVASLSEVAPGTATTFAYPGEHDPCLLIRTRDGELLAYSQKCTHLSCAVVPRIEEGVIHCPCHEGIFDLATGRNIAGPPPRPLPRILLEVSGDDVFAVGVELRSA